ncbi:uncharacterized protein METZ01_LOCUS148936, partial [marine metagenome]
WERRSTVNGICRADYRHGNNSLGTGRIHTV